MAAISIDQVALAQFGATWNDRGGSLSRTPPNSSAELGRLFERSVGEALLTMLGGIPIVEHHKEILVPPQPDCVETGDVVIIGGVRPQNFDVVYRPDGVRFAFDAKTLNDTDSVKKNWQNMINDLSTEATTVHSRFPYEVVAFLVAIPEPCLLSNQRNAMIETLERLARRVNVNDPVYLAEAISLVLWDPNTGILDPRVPDPESPIRIDKFSEYVERAYVDRYKGLPPHTK